MKKYKLLKCGCDCDSFRVYFTQYGVEMLVCNQCHEAISDQDVRAKHGTRDTSDYACDGD